MLTRPHGSSGVSPGQPAVSARSSLIGPGGGEGRYITDAEGKLVNSGAEEMAFPVGTWCYTSPNTMDGIRNDGTDQGSILTVNLIPTTE